MVGVPPARIHIPEVLGDVLSGAINPGLVLDYETDLDHVANAYAAMDQRRAIKSLIRVGSVSEVSAVAAWTPEELDRIGRAEELHLATRRRDGGLSRYVTMWVVRAGHELYVRSAYGPGNPWYRRATAAGEGRVRAGGVERDVTFASAGPAVQGGIDAAYHAKYDRYGPQIVGSVTGPQAHAVTIRLAKAGQHELTEGSQP